MHALGPLATLRVIEFAGLGPAPLAGQLLADLGADVIVVDRSNRPADPVDVNRRGKRSVVLDLKSDQGRKAVLRLIETSDILIEGYRPGVMERLGLGPDDCPESLIYGRMTGWGQSGPLAQRAGHDITYLAMTGVLNMLGPKDGPPVPPMNLAADYGGGTMFLLFGLLSAVIERATSGRGQVVDAAMIEGVPAMMGLLFTFMGQGQWSSQRASNLLDGGAPFYRCYTCADGLFVAVGALEPQFYAKLIDGLGLDPSLSLSQMDQSTWPDLLARFETIFARQPRDHWVKVFEGTDACVAPVLNHQEAAAHPHNVERQVFLDGAPHQASPAPRFSRTSPAQPHAPRPHGADTYDILTEIGLGDADVQDVLQKGAMS
ncbi:MAG: CaiB/BaiF CoA-transferase family protein [Paracoccaceae bacterium]